MGQDSVPATCTSVAAAHGGRVELEVVTRTRIDVHDRAPGCGARYQRIHPRRRGGASGMSRILIAEDEPRIASFIEKGLRSHGFVTSTAETGPLAAALCRDSDFDLMLLDLGLPGFGGREVLRQIRARGERLPVVVLTARSSVEAPSRSLDGGADDYLTKPFRFEELLARIRVRLRADAAVDSALLCVGEVVLDLRSRRITVDGRTSELTAREFALAETFMRHPGQVLAREQLLSHVWGYDSTRVERRGRLRALPAPEGRRRPDRDRTWHGLPPDRLTPGRFPAVTDLAMTVDQLNELLGNAFPGAPRAYPGGARQRGWRAHAGAL